MFYYRAWNYNWFSHTWLGYNEKIISKYFKPHFLFVGLCFTENFNVRQLEKSKTYKIT